jgi:hypothetical protein
MKLKWRQEWHREKRAVVSPMLEGTTEEEDKLQPERLKLSSASRFVQLEKHDNLAVRRSQKQ